MKADLAKPREPMWGAMRLADLEAGAITFEIRGGDPWSVGLGLYAIVPQAEYKELLAIGEAVERAPVAVVVSAHYDYVKIDPPNGIPLEMIGQRVRLLAIGEDG